MTPFCRSCDHIYADLINLELLDAAGYSLPRWSWRSELRNNSANDHCRLVSSRRKAVYVDRVLHSHSARKVCWGSGCIVMYALISSSALGYIIGSEVAALVQQMFKVSASWRWALRVISVVQ